MGMGMNSDPMSDFIALIMDAKPMQKEMPMAPGMHGELEAKGPMTAEQAMLKIKCIVKEYFSGCQMDIKDGEKPEADDWDDDDKEDAMMMDNKKKVMKE